MKGRASARRVWSPVKLTENNKPLVLSESRPGNHALASSMPSHEPLSLGLGSRSMQHDASASPAQARFPSVMRAFGTGLSKGREPDALVPVASSQSRQTAESSDALIASGHGLPGALRAGLEQLSGVSLSGIRVHRDSPAPARLGALAFTRVPDIHLAPGQEEHLPHEGWHAVQQLKGGVKATTLAGGTPINDEPRLERDADTFGTRAVQLAHAMPTLGTQQLESADTGSSLPSSQLQVDRPIQRRRITSADQTPSSITPAYRVVVGDGGYVYMQLQDGTIVILNSPHPRQVGLRLSSGSAWSAITGEIGPFPTPSQTSSDGAGEPLADQTSDSEASFLDTITATLAGAYSGLLDWFSSDDVERDSTGKLGTLAAESAQEVVAEGPLDAAALEAARAYYTGQANRYPGDMIVVLQEKVGVEQTGKFDDVTLQAIATYQEKSGLPVDGQAGRGTLTHMFGGDIRMRADAGSTTPVSKDGLKNVWDSAVLTAKIREAWLILQPEMPKGTQLTSGVRTWAKTAELVERYFLKSKDTLIAKGKLTEGEAARLVREKRYDDMSAYIRKNTYKNDKGEFKQMYVVAEVGASRHCTGRAMDLSGSSLDAIESAVKRVASTNATFGKLFEKTINEKGNNCVHIDLK